MRNLWIDVLAPTVIAMALGLSGCTGDGDQGRQGALQPQELTLDPLCSNPTSTSQVYACSKQVENAVADFFPPAESGVIEVGTVLANGTWTGAVPPATWQECDYSIKPPCWMETGPDPQAFIWARRAQLRFKFANPSDGQSQSVVVNGRRYYPGPGDTEITVDAGEVDGADFAVYVSPVTKLIGAHLVITRSLTGFGAFKMKALPIFVLYEPLPNNLRNYAAHSQSRKISTSSTATVTNVDMQSRQITPSKFEDIAWLNDKLSGIQGTFSSIASGATILKKWDNNRYIGDIVPTIPQDVIDIAKGIADGANILKGLLGSAKAMQTTTTTTSNGTTVEVTYATSQEVATWARSVDGYNLGGPGQGDIVYFLRGAQVAWVTSGSQVGFALLGYDTDVGVYATWLRQDLEFFRALPESCDQSPFLGPLTQLDCPTLTSLVELDPFILGGPAAELDPGRFVRFDQRSRASVNSDTWSHTLSNSTFQSTARSVITVEDYSKGFLSFLGLGVTENSHTRTEMTQSHSKTDTVTTETSGTIHLEMGPNPADQYTANLLYDNVFDSVVATDAALACWADAECASGRCAPGQFCIAPTCGDGLKNGTESDIDCGGGCVGCADGKACLTGRDCGSGVCDPALLRCSTATCYDGVRNGTETDVDCGGSCARCADGKACTSAANCLSEFCSLVHTCATPTCSDHQVNGRETGPDCGGPCATKCLTYVGCMAASDCVSGVCSGLRCAPPSCTDLVRNGDESGVDCGGSCALKCATGVTCGTASDCQSGVCSATTKTCSAPSCTDGVKNGTESGVDSGSTSGCGRLCNAGSTCKVAADCVSGTGCVDGVCQIVPSCIPRGEDCWSGSECCSRLCNAKLHICG